MSIKKSANYNEYIIECSAKDVVSIKYANVRETLYKIAKEVNFEYSENWGIQYFCVSLMKFIRNLPELAALQNGSDLHYMKNAKTRLFLIEYTYNCLEIRPNMDTLTILKDISKEINFAYHNEWNEQEFAYCLIDEINNTLEDKRNNKNKKEKYEDSSSISNEDWEWWMSLSDELKYELLNRVGCYSGNTSNISGKLAKDKFYCQDSSKSRYYIGRGITGVYYEKEKYFENGLLDSFLIRNKEEAIKLPYLKQIKTISVPFNFEDNIILSGFKNVKYVSISYMRDLNNELLASLDLINLKNMEALSLSSCNLIKISSELCGFIQLKELNLEQNSISSEELSKLSSLVNLKVLKLSSNKFSCDGDDNLEGLSQLTQLEVLDLDYCNINEFSNSFSKLTNLQKLFFSKGWGQEIKLTKNLKCLAFLINLKELDLSGHEFEDDLNWLSNLTKLEKLSLARCNLHTIPKSIGKLNNLKELDLDNVKFNFEISECLGALSSLKQLEKLVIGFVNNFNEIITLTNLKELKLDIRYIDYDEILKLSLLKELKSLCLTGNNARGTLIDKPLLIKDLKAKLPNCDVTIF